MEWYYLLILIPVSVYILVGLLVLFEDIYWDIRLFLDAHQIRNIWDFADYFTHEKREARRLASYEEGRQLIEFKKRRVLEKRRLQKVERENQQKLQKLDDKLMVNNDVVYDSTGLNYKGNIRCRYRMTFYHPMYHRRQFDGGYWNTYERIERDAKPATYISPDGLIWYLLRFSKESETIKQLNLYDEDDRYYGARRTKFNCLSVLREFFDEWLRLNGFTIDAYTRKLYKNGEEYGT